MSRLSTPADQTNLQFTLPDAATIGSNCQIAGDCVVQLFWATPDFSQNYYYCVDVVMAVAAPPTTSVAAQPPTTVATQTAATVVNVPAAAASSAVPKMVTSAASSAATAVAAVNGTAPIKAANANAGRRRARVLWF